MSSNAEFIESVLEDTKKKLKDYERRQKRVEALEGLNPRDAYLEYKLLVYREKVESTKIHIEVLEEELKIAKNQ